jgi:aerobic carbon-monoxide dehydrogenase medium subunit
VTRSQIDTYLRPSSLAEAWDLLRGGDPAVRVVSGGTDLTIACPAEVRTLVDVRAAIPAAIEAADDGTITIGAMATLTSIAEHPALAAHATGVIPEMLAHVGSPLLRNVCTIGGHLARGKLSDVIPVLLALDAAVIVHDDGETRLTLADYYEGSHHERPHLLTSIQLPALAPGSAAAFQRFARTAFDFPMANCCCRLSPGADGRVRIVVGATPQRGQRAGVAESIVAEGALDGDTFAAAADAAAAEIPTAASWIASAEYRTQLVRVLVRRTLEEAADRMEGRWTSS